MTQINKNIACQFCGSTDLSTNEWCLINDKETPAIECNNCFSGAPAAIWNHRTQIDKYRIIWQNKLTTSKSGSSSIFTDLYNAQLRCEALNKAFATNHYSVVPAFGESHA